MKSGCSAGTGTAGTNAAAFARSSCHQTSRPGVIGAADPVRRTTSTLRTGPPSASASSTADLSGTSRPRRHPPSAVTITTAPASATRSRTAGAENPPKITVCTAPSRAHASMAIAASAISGM